MQNLGGNDYKSGDVIGDYILQERLGGGEHSSTFKGGNQISQETVAIKIFSKSSSMSTNLYEAEINAYKTLRELPGILQLKDDGENNDVHFLVTEFIEEGSLRNILNKYPEGMNIEDVMQLFTPIADAIDRIHGKNIIHRDLKPENILYRKTEKSYETFIADFGIAKHTASSQQFQTGTTAGTPWYIAFEALVADPKFPQTKTVDIYALGVMLYEALEGQVPYRDIKDILGKKPPLDPVRTTQRTNVLVADYLLRAISHDPEKRTTSAKEAVSGIRNAHEGNLSIEQKWIRRRFNNYIVEEFLGLGKMGISLLAKEIETNTKVVLKAFTNSWSGNAIQAYDREKKSLDRLENGHGVLTPRDRFEHDDTLFLVTDYQSGGSLRNLLDRRSKLTTSEILEIFTQIAEAIDYIHEKKIVHRDIKPENIVYNTHEGKITPFITDFGVSIILASTQSSFRTHEIGTPRYMAPELWDKNSKGTKAVDIYAFGIMLYEALEGRAPFEADAPAIIKQHLYESVPTPERTLKDKHLGPNAKEILLHTLAKDPEERPKTAIEIMQQIRGQHAMFLGQRYGKYTIEKFIGKGTYGSTYRAYDVNIKQKKKFAFKVLSIPDPLMHEIEPLKKLGHREGIIPVLDGNSEKGIHYIVTDFLNFDNLREKLLSNQTGMNLEEALKIFKPVARALDYLHSNGIFHGDLKPENIILCKSKNETNSLEPVVTGFGVFKIAGKIHPYHAKSNWSYIAPELWEDTEPSSASDIYALGIMLYETLEGAPPFNAKSLAGIMKQHLDDNPPIPKNLPSSCEAEIVKVLTKALSKKPEQRQNSAQQLISDLEKAGRNQTSTAEGRISGGLLKTLRLLLNILKKNLTTAVLTIMVIMLSAVVVIQLLSPPSSSPLLPSPTAETPTVTLAPGETHYPIPIKTPVAGSTISSPPQCNLRYLPDQLGWQKDYVSDASILLESLYAQVYGNQPAPLDLYAVAYYNNRQSLETGLYHMIDPVKLDIDNGWKIFLPPPSWIDEYRTFPVPVLESIDQADQFSTLNIFGSSTLYPLLQQIKVCIEKMEPSYTVELELDNTKSGLIDFCQGQADIFVASAEVTPEMAKAGGCPSVNFLNFEVARYAAVIFISKNNPYAGELEDQPLNNDELERLLFLATFWSDVRDQWSKEPIIRYYPSLEGDSSVEGGVFEIVKNNFPNLDNKLRISNLEDVEDGNSISQMVADDGFSVGFSDFKDYQSKIGDLTAMPVNGVRPNLETIKGESPTYSLAHSLYLYTGKATFDENPLLRHFINFYLAYEINFLEELGYFYPDNTNGLLNDYYHPAQDNDSMK